MLHFSWLLGCYLAVDEKIMVSKLDMWIRLEYPTITRGAYSGRCSLLPMIYLRFFLRNEYLPKEYTLMGISPLYDRFSLFLTVCNNFCEVHIDNL